MASPGNYPITLPFDFPFYGEWYRTVTVSTQGYLVPGPNDPGSTDWQDPDYVDPFTPQPLPSPGVPEGVIAPAWSPVNEDFGTAVFTHGPVADGYLVRFPNAYSFDGDIELTFELVLSPDGTITYQYPVVRQANGDRMVAGIENPAGTQGFVLPDSVFATETAARFSPVG